MVFDILKPGLGPKPLPETPETPEYTTAWQSWKKEDTPQTRTALLESVRPVLDDAVRAYGAGSQGSPTLRTRAKLMALQAMQTYDPAKSPLRTHLMSHLRGLQRVGAREAAAISVPEQVALDWRRLHHAERNLEDNLGRAPSDQELADHTGFSLKRIKHVRKNRGSIPTGVLAAQPSDAPMPPIRPVGQTDDDAWINIVYHDLSPRDQVILQHTLGWNGNSVLNTAELAAKLGVTPGLISQRRRTIQDLLDQRYVSGLGL
jgi:DNA-directed RNA polymerase specialized sigma subunit